MNVEVFECIDYLLCAYRHFALRVAACLLLIRQQIYRRENIIWLFGCRRRKLYRSGLRLSCRSLPLRSQRFLFYFYFSLCLRLVGVIIIVFPAREFFLCLLAFRNIEYRIETVVVIVVVFHCFNRNDYFRADIFLCRGLFVNIVNIVNIIFVL